MPARNDLQMSRREAVGLLGLAGVAASVSWLTRDAELTAFQAAVERPPTPAFPPGAVIRTLLKDVAPDSLGGGPTLFHEHLSISIYPGNTPHDTADVSMMAE